MSHCCEDPTEPRKVDPRELLREQQRFGNLVRDLFTDDPEKVILRELNSASTYLRELAALRAHYPTVRGHAIELLSEESTLVLECIIDKEPDSDVGKAAAQRLKKLAEQRDASSLGKTFGKLRR